MKTEQEIDKCRMCGVNAFPRICGKCYDHVYGFREDGKAVGSKPKKKRGRAK